MSGGSTRVTDDACGLSRRWSLDPRLAGMVVALQERARDAFASQGVRFPGLWVISGWRSRTRQAAINPLAPDSRHTLCPSMAVDLRVGDLPASTTPTEIWATLGGIWKSLGGRWGGEFGDPNHFEALTVGGGPIAARSGARREVTPLLIARPPVVPQRKAVTRAVAIAPQIRTRPSLR